MIDVYNFLYLYATENEIEIYDCESESTVFEGYPGDYEVHEFDDYEVQSFDIESNGLLIINIAID